MDQNMGGEFVRAMREDAATDSRSRRVFDGPGVTPGVHTEMAVSVLPACECGCGRPRGVAVILPDGYVLLAGWKHVEAMLQAIADQAEKAFGTEK
jgi:hypothetical protein